MEKNSKRDLLTYLLGENKEMTRNLVFTRTKYGADRVAAHLKREGIKADAIHSNKTQEKRQKILQNFKKGKTRVLVASDIAARGINIDDISHVVNFDMPNNAEIYIHRIGRTGRAGASGEAMTFCGLDERLVLDEIEKLLDKQLPTIDDHPFLSPVPKLEKKKKVVPAKGVNARLRRPARKRRL